MLAALRAQAAVAAKIDVNAYVCIRDLPTLKAWVAEAREAGMVAFNVKTNSPDPMQADLVGFSLATRPGRAAYVPVAHRAGATDLLGGGLLDGQIPVREALAAAEAAARGPLGPQDRAERQIRDGGDEPPRHRYCSRSTTPC